MRRTHTGSAQEFQIEHREPTHVRREGPEHASCVLVEGSKYNTVAKLA